ncbi:MAG TPA: alanyl-tRNA editing protein [Thermoplasmata archaeon]|nr:alanyl-tRNA editing protein [Thermoplasmata archaeon]
MTELAYLPDLPSAYVRTFRARVVALPPGGVVLDRTYFYPGGGGQPPDRGRLRSGDVEWEVVDTARTGPTVVHRLRRRGAAAPPLALGSEVEGVIDWTRRYRHMRLHTGQHFLSARIFTRTGLRTAKAVLSGVGASLDLEGELPAAVLADLEADLAGALDHPHPITIRHVPRAEWDATSFAPRSGLVPLAPQVDPVRVVEIQTEDACPCGGTHVRSTREIGRLVLASPVAQVGGGCRLTFTLEDPELPTPPE